MNTKNYKLKQLKWTIGVKNENINERCNNEEHIENVLQIPYKEILYLCNDESTNLLEYILKSLKCS